MIGALLLALQQGPDAHYAGGATSKIAGTTALAGKFFRFLMSSVPQWIQISGVIIGGPIALILAWYAWKNRRELWAWWLARPGAVKFALVSSVGVVVVSVGGAGLYGYNYMMHDNDFCQSCHVMDSAWNRFQTTKHKSLQCHACHRQPLYVSSVELFYWVTERMMIVPPHDKVPTKVCSECHMRQGTDSARTLITLTAGHALHLKSDSSALKNVQCVTCHGRDFHSFKPTNATCAQSGCHMNVRVNLGVMSSKGFMHCTSCHDFKGKVPPGTTAAQARLAIAPKVMDCTSCHEMSKAILNFDLAADPHKGNCSMCHDAHKQKEPKDAFKTCATAQCHVAADTLTAFHRGLGSHALDQCGACHQAHSWKVRGTDCISCHKNINQDRPSARRVGSAGSVGSAGRRKSFHRVASRRRSVRSAQRVVRFASFIRPPADSAFRHSIHKSLTCTECHGTSNTHGAIKIVAPGGCLGCHHSAQQRVQCSTCHTAPPAAPYTLPMIFAITARPNPVTRPVAFTHARHTTLVCVQCHGTDVKRTVTTKCASCHTDHHTAAADCATCHTTARVGHDRKVHEGCAGCHTDAGVASLPAGRPVCIACHLEQRNHYPLGDCATCHALASHTMMSTVRGGKAP
ncbi:MAG: cytochrome c3 family protein [bacterium]